MTDPGGDFTNGHRDLGRHKRNAEAKQRAVDADGIYLKEYAKHRLEEARKLQTLGRRTKVNIWFAVVFALVPWGIGVLAMSYFAVKIIIDLWTGAFTS